MHEAVKSVAKTGRPVKHGMEGTPEYKAWANMKNRCSCKTHSQFHYYGGRGITVCERWNSFVNFFADMGKRPTPLHSLDRKDNEQGYTPENCRWATKREQQSNRRINHRLTINGETKCLMEWARGAGLKFATLRRRIARGMKPEDAITKPIDQARSACGQLTHKNRV